MDKRLFEVILTLIPVLCTILTIYIIPFIKAKIGNENLATYEYWADLAVKTAPGSMVKVIPSATFTIPSNV